VQSLAAERTGARVQWNQGTADDSAVARAVDSLLAHDLSADAAVQIALLNNRHLQATYEELGVAQADLVQAGLLTNPLLEGALHFGQGTSATGFELGLVQSFIGLFQRPLRMRAASAAAEQATLDVSAAVLDLAARTEVAYYQVQAAQQSRELRATVAEAVRLSADIARRQHEAGNSSALDLARAQALFEDAKLQLADADAALIDRREALTALMGLWGSRTQWTLPARLPDLPADIAGRSGLETFAIQHRLDLAAARQRIITLGASAGLTHAAALVPDLDVGVEMERDLEGTRSIGPTLGVRIPLFDQGRALNAAARSRVRGAQEEYAALAVDIRSDVRRAYARMRAAHAKAERLRTVVIPLRTTIVNETQLHYNGMLVGVFELLESKRDQIEAGAQYVDALRDYWVARAELMRAAGGRLPERM
jgi:cobalt-zinc-cadmium efflux system outer membrane protein